MNLRSPCWQAGVRVARGGGGAAERFGLETAAAPRHAREPADAAPGLLAETSGNINI